MAQLQVLPLVVATCQPTLEHQLLLTRHGLSLQMAEFLVALATSLRSHGPLPSSALSGQTNGHANGRRRSLSVANGNGVVSPDSAGVSLQLVPVCGCLRCEAM